jgi:hypothetical protein
MLAQHVRANGGIPSSSAGPWGVFTKLFEGAASLVSEQAVLDAIRAGEKQTTSTYKAMVDRAIQEDAVETHVIREGMLAQLDAERRMGQIMS